VFFLIYAHLLMLALNHWEIKRFFMAVLFQVVESGFIFGLCSALTIFLSSFLYRKLVVEGRYIVLD
jgi:hypothetical protein